MSHSVVDARFVSERRPTCVASADREIGHWGRRFRLYFFGRKRLVDQPHGAVHCSSPRLGCAGFNGPFVQLDRPLPCAALDTLDNGVLLASILHPTSPTKSPVRKIAFPERGEVEVESPSNRKRKGSYHRAGKEQSRDLTICGNVSGQPGLTGAVA
jgi:hypothetical protein